MQIKRYGNKLIITPAYNKKQPTIFIDVIIDSLEQCHLQQMHRCIGTIKDNSILIVQQTVFEGGWYILVDIKSGASIAIDELPILSPNQNNALVISRYLIAQFNTNSVGIYALSDSGFLRGYYINLNKWGQREAKWLNNNEVEVI